jgi:putative membrane protein
MGGLILSAAGIPAWEPHSDVWLLVAALGAGYAIALTRLGPRHAGPGAPAATRLQVVSFSLGLVTLWLMADWPVHDVAERSMYSVHMIQHLMLTMVAAPLLLLGTPGWLARWLFRPPSAGFRVLRSLSRFFPALVIVNLVLVFSHWPLIVDISLHSGVNHFLLHVLLFASALVVWMPVVSPLPEIPRLAAPVRAVFLFLQSVVPTVPASFLTFGATPLYKFYVGKPHLWQLSTLEDQQVAGLIMKIGAGMLLWTLIAVIFFRWAADEDRHSQPQRLRRELERELEQIQAEGADEGVNQ